MGSVTISIGSGSNDLEGVMEQANDEGADQQRYKDLARKAADFRGMTEGRKVYEQYKDMAREKRAKNRVSLRRAEKIVEDRAQRRSGR